MSLSSALSIFDSKDVGLQLNHFNFESFFKKSYNFNVFNINGKTSQKKEGLKCSVNWNETLSINNLRILVGILFGPIALEWLTLKRLEGRSIWPPTHCGFLKNVSSKERVKPWFLWLLILS